jgi:hypothetical protein
LRWTFDDWYLKDNGAIRRFESKSALSNCRALLTASNQNHFITLLGQQAADNAAHTACSKDNKTHKPSP